MIMPSVLDAVNDPHRPPHQARALIPPAAISIGCKWLTDVPFSEELPSAELDHGLSLHSHLVISLG